MKWTLFARLEQTVARARRLDAHRDRAELARMLVLHNPTLGLDDPGSSEVASILAGHALTLLSRLPKDIDEAAASIVDPNPLAPTEALARVAALAYVALCDDILPDDLPGGVGLIDDAISLRATGVGAPNGWDQDERARQLDALGLEARFLSLFLPRERMAEFDRALDELFWTITAYARVPLAELKDVTRRLIEQPPQTLVELLPDFDAHEPIPRPKLFGLCDAQLEVIGSTLHFRFTDGVEIELADGQLRLTSNP